MVFGSDLSRVRLPAPPFITPLPSPPGRPRGFHPLARASLAKLRFARVVYPFRPFYGTPRRGAACGGVSCNGNIDFLLREVYILVMPFDHDSLEQALVTLGDLLKARGEEHDLAVVGGGALLILGLIERPTKDLDVVAQIQLEKWSRAEPFPKGLAEAVRDVARALGLANDWLNPGPTDLLELGLPAGFAQRAVVHRYGSLTIRFASRQDQIAFKLYATVDQGPNSKHFADLRRLEPTAGELLEGARWTRTHDPSEGFHWMLSRALRAMGVDPDDV